MREDFQRIIDAIKAAVRIEDLVGEKFSLKQSGARFVGVDHDSMVVIPESGMYFWNSRGEYGDVFDFVGRYHLGYGSGWNNHDPVQFREAVEHLAERAGIPIERGTDFRQTAAWAERQLVQRLHDALLNTPPALTYATQTRGWDVETIRLAKLGYMPSDKGRLLEGLNLSDRWREVVGRFPAGMLVYVHRDQGRLMYLSGRSIEGKQHYNPPRELIGAKQPYFNHCYADDARQVVVVEGQADAISFGAWGIPAVAIAGLTVSDELLERLKRHGRVFVALDNTDDAGAQRRLIAAALGGRAYLPQLPPGVKDANEWLVRDHATAEDAGAMLNSAQHWLDAEIARVAELDGLAREDALHTIIAQIADLGDPITTDRLKQRITTEFNLSASSFNAILRRAADHQETQQRQQEPEILSGITQVAPAQAFVDGMALVIISHFVTWDNETTAREPYLVTSARDQTRLRPGQRLLLLNGQRLALHGEPGWQSFNGRWENVHVQRFLAGETVAAREVYSQIHELIAASIDFISLDYAALVTLYTIGTYFYQLFPAYPYLWLNGPQNSGKTSLLTLLQKLAFNMISTTDISPSSIFRLIHQYGCTVGIDEAEQYQNPRDLEAQHIRRLLNGGYRRDTAAYRVSGEAFIVEEFNIYSPKIIAGIEGLEKVLASRCIVVPMHRERRERPALPDNPTFAELRHALYTLMLTRHTDIRHLAEQNTLFAAYHNRHRDLFRPLVTLAAFFEAHGLTGLVNAVHTVAATNRQTEDAQALSDERQAVLQALERLTRDRDGDVHRIPATELRAEIEALLGDSLRSSNQIGFLIRGLHVRAADDARNSAGVVYMISRAKVQDMMKRYEVSSVTG